MSRNAANARVNTGYFAMLQGMLLGTAACGTIQVQPCSRPCLSICCRLVATASSTLLSSPLLGCMPVDCVLVSAANDNLQRIKFNQC